MSLMDISPWIVRAREIIEHALESAIADGPDTVPELRAAMRYSLLAGGKRLRPLLVLASARAAGGDEGDALPAALAVEMIHTYSLIHDDLPAMDDDELRRGRATNHVVFGEAMAILAGDALHTLAFETVAHAALPADRVRAMVATLARAAGPEGMCGGQVLDLLQEGRPADERRVERIHELKTGALLAASFRLGAEAVGAAAEIVARLESCGRHTGLAFQIQDDILDETASTEALGKTAGKDKAANKATWPAVFGLERARGEVRRQTDAALAALVPLGAAAESLAALVSRAANRQQ